MSYGYPLPQTRHNIKKSKSENLKQTLTINIFNPGLVRTNGFSDYY